MTAAISTGVTVIPGLWPHVGTGDSTAVRAKGFEMPGANDVGPGAEQSTSLLIENANRSAALERSPFDRIIGGVLASGENMESIRSQVQELLEHFRTGRIDHTEAMIQLLGMQGEMQRAAMGLEMVSKTVEMGTNGVNTLARTQT